MLMFRHLTRCLRAVIVTACCLVFLPSGVLAQESNEDPFEGFNRAVFRFNDVADRYALRPLASGYRYVTPDPLEAGFARAFDNAAEPVNVVNSLLQGKFSRAANDTGRFLLNSTFGLLGLVDVAGDLGLEKEDGEDFGQTLGAWGVESGPYLVLPFLGPSTVRDMPARFVDSRTNPLGYLDPVSTRNSLYGLRLLSDRAQLMQSERLLSGDKYLFTRDVYLQRRRHLVNDGRVEDSFGRDYDDGGDSDSEYGDYEF